MLLPPESENWTIDVFGFIPKRYDSTLLDVDFPGGAGAKVWTFVTYSLLHANLSHIGFNVLWLLPFGSALARRFGAVRFFLFMAVTAAAGALAHLVTHEHAMAPMIGASASVSGAMAAAIRFAFVQGQLPVVQPRRCRCGGARCRRCRCCARCATRACSAFSRCGSASTSSSASARSRSAAEGASVAWQAHIGGFFAGPDAVLAVRSGAARNRRCCRCVDRRIIADASERRLRRGAISSIIAAMMRQDIGP